MCNAVKKSRPSKQLLSGIVVAGIILAVFAFFEFRTSGAQAKIEKYLPNFVPTKEQFKTEIKSLVMGAQKKGYNWFVSDQGNWKELNIEFDGGEISMSHPDTASMPGLIILRVKGSIRGFDYLSITDDNHNDSYGLLKAGFVRQANSQDQCDEFKGDFIDAEVDKKTLDEINKNYFACLRYINAEIL